MLSKQNLRLCQQHIVQQDLYFDNSFRISSLLLPLKDAERTESSEQVERNCQAICTRSTERANRSE